MVVIAVAAAACAWVLSGTRATPPASAPASAIGAVDELVDSAAQCEDVCGSECVAGGGRLRCPRRCHGDRDCQGDAICALSRLDAAGERVRRCLASECTTHGSDADCGAGRVCLYEARPKGGLFRCHAAGARKLGEACVAEVPSAGCAVGLECHDGLCLPSPPAR